MSGRFAVFFAAAALFGCQPGMGEKRPVEPDRSPRPIAPFSPGIVHGNYVFVAGQGPVDPKTGKYEPSDIKSEVRLALENVKAILEAGGSSLDKVVKVNVYLRDMKDFAAMNEVYATYFKPPYPARTTIQAGALPRGFGVEIDCVAYR